MADDDYITDRNWLKCESYLHENYNAYDLVFKKILKNR
jgi:hypothetical protein